MTEEFDGCEPAADLHYEADLDAAPETVWRAVTEPELLARWLPELTADENGRPAISAEPVFTEEGEEVHYKWHDIGLPEFDTFVIIDLKAREDGGTHLRITHQARPAVTAANDNSAALMRAA